MKTDTTKEYGMLLLGILACVFALIFLGYDNFTRWGVVCIWIIGYLANYVSYWSRVTSKESKYWRYDSGIAWLSLNCHAVMFIAGAIWALHYIDNYTYVTILFIGLLIFGLISIVQHKFLSFFSEHYVAMRYKEEVQKWLMCSKQKSSKAGSSLTGKAERWTYTNEKRKREMQF